MAHLDGKGHQVVDGAAEHRDPMPACQSDRGVEHARVIGHQESGRPALPHHPYTGIDQPAALTGCEVEDDQIVGTDSVQVSPAADQPQSAHHRVTGPVPDLGRAERTGQTQV